MSELIKTYWQLCLLRIGPQDLPNSSTLLYATLAVYLVVDFALTILDLSFGASILASFLDAGLLLSFTGLLLWGRSLPERMIQAFTALLGSGALLGALAFPLLSWQFALGIENPYVVMPSLLLLVLLIWNITVVGHIFRHALSGSMGLGVGLSVLYVFISINIMRSLFYTV